MTTPRHLLEGAMADEARAELARKLAANELSDEAIDEAFAPPAAPDVFAAAYARAHPPARRWWWVPALVAVAASVVVVVAWRPTDSGERLKGDGDVAAVTLVALVVDDHGAARRVEPLERLHPGDRLVFRATSSRPAAMRLRYHEGDGWPQVWPSAPEGLSTPAGEFELRDQLGAVSLTVPTGLHSFEVRLDAETPEHGVSSAVLRFEVAP